ncbi:hypothetical protein MPTK1_7g06350 [Marchantia polymorpha subsp. ruderalis]|uniref:Uncharacterized protein n=2 Tax=Marchantia polymorpha TaxID=3197 RepID=A0AAF6BWQ9_MARPO|nr:hypothetical protein MARPO_0057s0036 [Marchantia polymorpha]BBN16443.1 hypothetical protein Mp_7g06350 [Marchantia polymorpha subsp. ruderalis]|eukprot:PTQ37398.1 hypothetical protein MARPO_0057s0036 [Marchantia polymorpha]
MTISINCDSRALLSILTDLRRRLWTMMASYASFDAVNNSPMPAPMAWRDKCIERSVGFLATMLVLWWKVPVASAMYLVLVAWSFTIYESALASQATPKTRPTTTTTPTTSGAGTSTRLQDQQPIPRGDGAGTPTHSQDLSRLANTTRLRHIKQEGRKACPSCIFPQVLRRAELSELNVLMLFE